MQKCDEREGTVSLMGAWKGQGLTSPATAPYPELQGEGT